MDRHLGLLTGLLLLSLASPSFASVPKLAAAFEDSRGNLLIELESSSAPAESNRMYWGSPRELFQLEALHEGESEGVRRLEFYDFRFTARASGVMIEGQRAEVNCGRARYGMSPLTPVARERLERGIAAGLTRFRRLPSLRRPLYLFQRPGNGELVYVTEPVFNFRGDYEVFLGQPGRLRKVPLRQGQDPVRMQKGEILFANGGGLYIPAAIDLFKTSQVRRGSPVLVRDEKSPLENLIRPRLAPAQLARAGIRSIVPPPVKTPCDSIAAMRHNKE